MAVCCWTGLSLVGLNWLQQLWWIVCALQQTFWIEFRIDKHRRSVFPLREWRQAQEISLASIKHAMMPGSVKNIEKQL